MVLKAGLISLLGAIASFAMVAMGFPAFKALVGIFICAGVVSLLAGGVAHSMGNLENDVTKD
ncbi:hypothetical protein MNR01_13445 [Lysobacter sp. S4-A87]|uniref:hypothetical protein n=1 Tax=Lysobacter sp. S4-A87 TaxID=2925843 RepID=UPI001F52C6A4|nr:hypothetical protein [Lysobacter sp. S4-A87]UNK48741.1 hypothetical protein MNR01_13445 [Lysobacter sp. S4-A87]